MTFNGFYPYSFRYGAAIDTPGYTINDNKLQTLRDAIAEVPEGNTIIVHNAVEWMPIETVQALANRLQGVTANRMVWVLQEGETPVDLPGHETLTVNLDFIQMWIETRVYGSSSFRASWPDRAREFLLLIGKPWSGHRLELLRVLSDRNLLDLCRYSLIINDTLLDLCRNKLADLNDEDYLKWWNTHQRRLDDIQPFHNRMPGWHKAPYPINLDLYDDIAFQVVCETQVLDHHVSVTEKTWLPIAHRCPFIMGGHPGIIRELEQRGYRTFREYLVRPDYDDIADPIMRLEAVADNVAHWQHHITRYRDDIRRDLDHNYELLSQQVDLNWQRWQHLHRVLDAPEFDLTRILPLGPERAIWVNWYWNVRGPDWPDCICREHFGLLPDSIQQELQDKFGLPKF